MPQPHALPFEGAPQAAPAPLRVLVDGWRGVSHSFAMVNQHQLLALQRAGGVALFHRDVPFFMPHWNAKDTGAGFAAEQAHFIASLGPLEPALADVVYRISAPILAPEKRVRRQITFAVTEFGLSPRSFAQPELPLSAYTDAGHLVVTPSRWSRDRLLDHGFAEPGVRVVRHGVDREACRPLSAEERALNRRNLGFREDETVFLNVGLPAWNKGVDLLVAAFAQVHAAVPGARLVIKDAAKLYGLGAERVLTDLAARQPGLVTPAVLSAISIVGANLSQAELRLLYGVADCYVSPYRAEGFNLPVLEALACGTPVIVTSGGATDDFCDGEAVRKIPSTFRRGGVPERSDGCMLEPHLPSLAEHLVDAARAGPLHNPQHPLRLAARQATTGWTWDTAAHELLALLRG